MPATRRVLITLLGRSEKRGGGYRETQYVLPDHSKTEPTAFLGWELRKILKPEEVIVLGTRGSMWDWLIEPADEQRYENFDQLVNSVSEMTVTQEQLAPFARDLSQHLETKIVLKLIGDCYTEEEQLDLLRQIEPLVHNGDELFLDLSHGFRHLPILLMMAAVYLRSLKSVTIGKIYTSFYHAESGWGVVFDLSGLLRLISWHTALNSFEKDGDPGAFVDLLEQDGLVQQLIDQLNQASYYNRINDHQRAWPAERAVANALEQGAVRGVSALFAPRLIEYLARREDGHEADRLARMARRQLDIANFDRAALLALSAGASRYRNAGETLEQAHRVLLASQRADGNFLSQYHLLARIRNFIAHTGDSRPNLEVRNAVQNEAALSKTLVRIFDSLFPR